MISYTVLLFVNRVAIRRAVWDTTLVKVSVSTIGIIIIILVIINYLMYNELILSVQKFKESSPDTDVIPDGEKLLFINYFKKKHRIFNIYILNSGFI